MHRNTVLAAYDEFVAEGWLTTSEASGTFVSDAIPDTGTAHLRDRTASGVYSQSRSLTPISPVPYPIRPAPLIAPRTSQDRPDTLDLSSGTPDLESFSLDALRRAYRRAPGIRGRPDGQHAV